MRNRHASASTRKGCSLRAGQARAPSICATPARGRGPSSRASASAGSSRARRSRHRPSRHPGPAWSSGCGRPRPRPTNCDASSPSWTRLRGSSVTAYPTQRGKADITGAPGRQLTVASRDGYVQGAAGSTMLQALGAGQADRGGRGGETRVDCTGVAPVGRMCRDRSLRQPGSHALRNSSGPRMGHRCQRLGASLATGAYLLSARAGPLRARSGDR